MTTCRNYGCDKPAEVTIDPGEAKRKQFNNWDGDFCVEHFHAALVMRLKTMSTFDKVMIRRAA